MSIITFICLVVLGFLSMYNREFTYIIQYIREWLEYI